MKRSTIVLSALLLILIAAVFLIYNSESEPDNVFHIEDASVVNSVEMEKIVRGEAAEVLKLDKGEDGIWMLDGKYTAIQSKVENLLKTMTQIRVVANVEPAGQESALKLLKKNHTRVKVSGPDGKIKDYLIGATNSQHSANIMMIDGAEKVYMVSKPGFQGYVSVFYNTVTMEWRERTLFNLTPQNLKRVKIEYPTTPDQKGFDLRRDKEGDPWMAGEGILADVDRVGSFVNLFEGKISAESFANTAYPEMRDSLDRRTADVIFTYETLKGKSGTLKLFTRPDNVNNYFGFLEGRPELYTIQRFVMDKYLKTEGYFVPNVTIKEPDGFIQ